LTVPSPSAKAYFCPGTPTPQTVLIFASLFAILSTPELNVNHEVCTMWPLSRAAPTNVPSRLIVTPCPQQVGPGLNCGVVDPMNVAFFGVPLTAMDQDELTELRFSIAAL